MPRVERAQCRSHRRLELCGRGDRRDTLDGQMVDRACALSDRDGRARICKISITECTTSSEPTTHCDTAAVSSGDLAQLRRHRDRMSSMSFGNI